jgi:hypothetical protein
MWAVCAPSALLDVCVLSRREYYTWNDAGRQAARRRAFIAGCRRDKVQMKTAREWKEYYQAERDALGEAGLLRLLDESPFVEYPRGGALIFPHTRLATSGALVAAAAQAVVRGGCDEVIALGVLHGAREVDAERVHRARAGEEEARRGLRRVHGPYTARDAGVWQEEFSLDNFQELVHLAVRCDGVRAPRVRARYPFLVGPHPEDLPGLEELRRALANGAALVATADMIHHGAGYETPPEAQRSREDARTLAWARESIERGCDLLARRDFAGFLAHSLDAKSDFRDGGPVLATLLTGRLRFQLHALTLVDYAEALRADEPTWVAAALLAVNAM